MIDKILRAPLPDQFKALLEKLDNDPEASSLYAVRNFVNDHARSLTRYERYVFKRAFHKINRASALDKAMGVVLGVDEDSKQIGLYSSSGKPITVADITRESFKVLEKNLSGMNAPIKREGERVNY